VKGGKAMKEFNENTRFEWTTGEAIILPEPDKAHPVVSVKDPSVLYYNGKWYVFYTTCDEKAEWSMQFISFNDWKDVNLAIPFFKDDNPNLLGYRCAPQVFYFRPQKKWYMIFQANQPQYSTNDNIDDPLGWSKPADFFSGVPKSVVDGSWLDYWVICDDEYAYLFFSGNNGRFYRSLTAIKDFPKGMSEPEVAISNKERGELFEGSCTYRIKGQKKFLTIIEAFGPTSWDRYYRSFVSDSLDGIWKEQAAKWDAPFAGINNVKFDEGVKPWTRDISHGEIIRDGYDETLTIDPENLRMLFQGRDAMSNGRQYHLLPYRIGLLIKK
jgi:hypothetical protein